MNTTPDDSLTTELDDQTPICEVPLQGEPPALPVIEAVARAGDVSPVDVQPRLSDVVDPDAVDRLFASVSNGPGRSEGRMRFRMGAWLVLIDWGDGCVRVFDADDP